jgi:serine/threonine protein kinase
MEKGNDALKSGKFPKSNQRLGSYYLDSMIDFDNSGALYRAIDNHSERSVFLKVLSETLAGNPSFLDVLRIQMQTASIADHPGIAALYDIGESGGYQYFTYESTPLGLLSQEISCHGKLSVSEALEMMISCAETLQAAAELRIFHGNLRVNSILLFSDHVVKISELGFAAAVRALFGFSNFAVYLGATRFLAPEMTTAQPVDYRADIYSLGLILYFLLFNATPFRYEGERLPEPTEKTEIENLPEILKVISKMTEANPDKRYQDYDSLIQDLRSLFIQCAPIVKVPRLKRSSGEGIKNQKLFKLMCVLFASRSNGSLSVIDGPARRTFYIRDRHVIYFESNQPEENIWKWLVQKKEMEAKNVPRKRETLHGTLNNVLTKKAIRLEDFRYNYQQLANRTLSEVLKEPGAESEFISAEVEGDALCTNSLSGLLLKAARYTVNLEDVLKEIKPNSFLDRTPLFESLVSALPLTKNESMLVSVSQEGIFTGKLDVRPGSSAEKGARFIYLLKQMGALEVRSGDRNQPQLHPELSAVTKTPPGGFQMDERQPGQARGEDWVREELQKTAKKSTPERLDREAERRFEQAQEYFRQDKFWEAANLCEQALNLHEDARYYWLMGLSYAQHPRFRHKAEDCFHRAIVLDPVNDDLHADLADFYVAQGLLLRARTHAFKALQIIPDQIRAREILETPGFETLGRGGCCCEHDPACHHIEHRAWRPKKKY